MKILSILASVMISTSMVFAQTEVDAMAEASKTMNEIQSLSDSNLDANHSKGMNKILNRIDALIARAEKSNKPIEVTIDQLEKAMTKHHTNSKSDLERTLNNKKALNRLVKKAQSIDPSVTQVDIQNKIEMKMDTESFNQRKVAYLHKVRASGTYAQFLKNLKQEILEEASSQKVAGLKKVETGRQIASLEFQGEMLLVTLMALGIIGVLAFAVSTLGWLLGFGVWYVAFVAVGFVYGALTSQNATFNNKELNFA